MKATYTLGSVPELSVWTDETMEVRLRAPFEGRAIFALDATADRDGLALDAASGMLTYRPGESAAMPFPVTVVARASEGPATARQTIAVVPKPRERPSVITLAHFSQEPDRARDYLQVTERVGEEADFNGARVRLHHVEVCGVQVVLEANSDAHPLFRRLDGRSDMASLRLDADEIVLRGVLRLPGTRVTIHARRLVFEDRGEASRLDTTPVSVAEPSSADGGARGQKAGSVEIVADAVVASGAETRIRACGANGQPARRGVPGASGGDIDPWNGKASTRTYWMGHETLDWARMSVVRDGFTPVRADVYSYYAPGVNKVIFEGTVGDPDHWPGNGSPPRVYPGRPGPGGDGGDVTLSRPDGFPGRIAVDAGEPGEKALRIAPARAGTPVKASWVKATFQQWVVPPLPADRKAGDGTLNMVHAYEVLGTNVATDGPEGPSLDVDPNVPPGRAGAVRAATGPWLQARALRSVIAYLKDCFLANRIADKRDLARLYLASLDTMTDPAIELGALRAELQGLIEAIDGPYDYFGNPAGWVPMLSFEANLSRYEADVDSSIRAIFFAKWIEKRQDETAAAARAVESALALLESEGQSAAAGLVEAQATIEDLTRRYDRIANDGKRLAGALRDLERDIKRIAKDDLQREHALRASAKILGGVLQLVPVGQPALGMAGKGLDILSEMDFDAPLDSAGDIAGLGAEIAKQALGPKIDKLLASMKEAGKSETTDPKKAKFQEELAKKELDEKVKGHMEAQKAAKTRIKEAMSGFSVPQAEVDAEFERIAQTHEEYRKLVGQIADVSARQKVAAADLAAALEAVDEAVATMLNARLGRISLGANLNRTLKELDIEARQAARGLGQRARDRLLRYQYALVKSYHYLMVSDAEGVDYAMARLLDSFGAMLGGDSPTLTQDQVASLRTVFEDQLRTVTDPIVDWYQKHPARQVGAFSVTLAPAQIAALNEDRAVEIDLFEMGYLDPDIEDVRIAGIATEAVEVTDAPSSGAAGVSLTYVHGGEGIIRRGGRRFLFRTGGRRSGTDGAGRDMVLDDRRFWRTDISLLDGTQREVHENPTNPVEASLIRRLLRLDVAGGDDGRKTDVLTDFQPPAWARMTIRRSATPLAFAGRLKSLTFRIRHVYHQVSDRIATIVIRAPGAPAPFVAVDALDLSGAAGGRATFLRSYDKGLTRTVSLTAPRTAGNMVFLGWRWLHHRPDRPNTAMMPLLKPASARAAGDASDLFSSPTFALEIDGDMVIDAVYGERAGT